MNERLKKLSNQLNQSSEGIDQCGVKNNTE